MNHADDFDELAALLPFYANGRLDPAQRARIEAALATMPTLRAELAEVQALHTQIKTSSARIAEPQDGPETRSQAERLRNLQARIAAETQASAPATPVAQTRSAPPTTTAPPAALQARIGSRRSRFRPSFGMALAAGLAAISIVQGVMLHRLQSDAARSDDTYASLSGPTEHATPAGPRFSLRFRAETNWSDIQTLCERLNLRIVSGPEEGMIDVAPTDGLNPSQIEALEAALKRSSSVAFVGRQG